MNILINLTGKVKFWQKKNIFLKFKRKKRLSELKLLEHVSQSFMHHQRVVELGLAVWRVKQFFDQCGSDVYFENFAQHEKTSPKQNCMFVLWIKFHFMR